MFSFHDHNWRCYHTKYPLEHLYPPFLPILKFENKEWGVLVWIFITLGQDALGYTEYCVAPAGLGPLAGFININKTTLPPLFLFFLQGWWVFVLQQTLNCFYLFIFFGWKKKHETCLFICLLKKKITYVRKK